MAYPSVTDAQHRASNGRVNDESDFDERPRPWWRRSRATQATAVAVQHSTFPQPDAPTQAIPAVPGAVPKPQLPQVLYRERPADLDMAAYNISLAAANAGLHRWSAIKLEEALAVHLRVLHRLAEQERDEGRRLLARSGNGAAAAVRAVETIEGAVQAEERAASVPGVNVSVAVNPGALGKGIVAVTANQGAVQDPTAQFSRLTPELLAELDALHAAASTTPAPVEVTVVDASPLSFPPSPVHLNGAPPIPADADESADPDAHSPLAASVLPRRPLVTVLPAPMTDGEHPEPIGLHGSCPARGEVNSGDWVFDAGANGADVLKLVRGVVIVRDGEDGAPVGARVFFADGSDRRVRGVDGAVQAMDGADAMELLEKYEAQLAEMEAAL